MSRWWMRPLRALIEPGRARLGAHALAASGTGWQEALAALEELLAQRRGARLELVLSNHFVRFLVVPWDGSLAAGEERSVFLSHHFGTVYGPRAADWACSVASAGEGSRLAAAIDAALLDQARALAARCNARLGAVLPLAVAEYNRARRTLKEESLFFAVLEPERACALLVRGKQVSRVANRRAADPAAELKRMVTLESAAIGAAGALPVYTA